MLYSFQKQDELPFLPTVNGLTINECSDPQVMARLGQISVEEAANRFANQHKAYVAFLDKQPAAFGWVAREKARIGELNHELILPCNHRYLWNFKTLPELRGLGIYPLLLQFILTDDYPQVECFWVMHAPENTASERGIRKAGFTLMGTVSVIDNDVIFATENKSYELSAVLQTFGFMKSEEQQASCWNCSSPYLKNRKPECCCSAKQQECTRNLFVGV